MTTLIFQRLNLKIPLSMKEKMFFSICHDKALKMLFN